MSLPFSITKGFAPEQTPQAAKLFWGAFAEKLGVALGPEERALAFLERVIDPRYAFAARAQDGALLGLAGYKTRQGTFVGGDFKDLAAVYGWFGAAWRAALLGLLEREPDNRLLLMDGIFVSARARGLGIGSALLDAIAEEALRQALSGVRLDVIDSNPKARALYERKGFEARGQSHTGPFRRIFKFRSATAMVKPLSPHAGRVSSSSSSPESKGA